MQWTHLFFEITIDTFVIMTTTVRSNKTHSLAIYRTFVLTIWNIFWPLTTVLSIFEENNQISVFIYRILNSLLFQKRPGSQYAGLSTPPENIRSHTTPSNHRKIITIAIMIYRAIVWIRKMILYTSRTFNR